MGLSECLMFDDALKTFTCIMSGRWNLFAELERLVCVQGASVIYNWVIL